MDVVGWCEFFCLLEFKYEFVSFCVDRLKLELGSKL